MESVGTPHTRWGWEWREWAMMIALLLLRYHRRYRPNFRVLLSPLSLALGTCARFAE